MIKEKNKKQTKWTKAVSHDDEERTSNKKKKN
jgi:hypothetical protein